MTIINFYHLTSGSHEKAACQLLEKCYKSDYKTIVKVSNEEVQESLNKTLWTFAQKSFIPHGSANDAKPEMQPIYITTTSENPNNASVLMLVGTMDGIYDDFERVFVIFDGRDDGAMAQAKGVMEKLQTSKNQVSYFQQTKDGSWAKV